MYKNCSIKNLKVKHESIKSSLKTVLSLNKSIVFENYLI